MKLLLCFLSLSLLFISYSSAQPVITSVDPDSAQQGQSLPVYITGQNTNFAQGSLTINYVWLSQADSIINSSSTYASSNTYLQADFSIPSNANTGLWDVNVYNSIDDTILFSNGFKINLPDPAPAAPALYYPTNASTITSHDSLFFSWSAPIYAYQYELIVGSDTSFTSPEIQINNLSSNSYTPNPLINGVKYWKVRAKNIANIWGPWSDTSSFTLNAIPGLISLDPDSAQQGQILSVYITGQNTHFLQGTMTTNNVIWLSKAGSTINSNSDYAYNYTYLRSDFTIPTNADTGLWDVHVYNNINDTINMVNGFAINLPDPVPAAPTLNYPAIGSTITSHDSLFFNWSAPTYAYQYELVIDSDTSFSSPEIQIDNLSTTSYTYPLINGIKYWKVRAKNITDIWGPWSTTFNFTLNAIPAIISVVSDSAKPGQDLTVYITGQNTHFMQSTTTINYVWLSQGISTIYGISYSIYNTSNTYFRTDFTIPINANTGLWDVNVYNSIDDTITLNNGFKIDFCKIISGNVYLDGNGNCIFDGGELPLENMLIRVDPGPIYATTDNTGYYNIIVPDTGTYSISQIPPQNPFWIQSCPASLGNYTIYVDSCETGIDFGDTSTSTCPILEVDISTTFFRRCFQNTFAVQYCNYGNSSASNVSIELTLDSNIVPLNSTLTWTYQSGVYSFNIGTLQPNTCGTFYLTDSISCNTILGDTLCVNAKILPVITCGGVDTMGFQSDYNYCRFVIGSYDPNEKLLISPMTKAPDYFIRSTDEMHYQVNFQNTGTDTAFTVVIRDTLSEFLDITTVKNGTSSHPSSFRIYGQGILEWTFNNILLPDSFVNEPASHGFVKYSVEQKANNPDGTSISNNAAIYFDYNAPVITNTVVNTINNLLGITDKFYVETRIIIYPNPFTETAKFQIIDNRDIKQYYIQFFDIAGRKINELMNVTSKIFYIKKKNFSSGLYFYKIVSEKEVIANGKFIVQ
ncbi:T9SS type A sorting domain-containing protein [Candidatus Amoebophilus asiaticus]|nr:T9SS type A sorting domain-containing protein [Candidatus Amoebophilus asiaticus]